MERSSIVHSFAWMERLHYALACLAFFPLLSSDMLPFDAGGAGKLPERKQTNPYAVRAGGRRIRRCMCVADFNRVQDVHRDREEYARLDPGSAAEDECYNALAQTVWKELQGCVVGTHGCCGLAGSLLRRIAGSWACMGWWGHAKR